MATSSTARVSGVEEEGQSETHTTCCSNRPFNFCTSIFCFDVIFCFNVIFCFILINNNIKWRRLVVDLCLIPSSCFSYC